MRKEKMIKPYVTNYYLLGTFTQNAQSIGYSLIFLLTVFTSASAPAGDGVPANPTITHKVKIINHFQVDHNGPAEFIVQNVSQGRGAMTEIRALGAPTKTVMNGKEGAGVCAIDLGTTGPNYQHIRSDPTLKPNEAFIVEESTCEALHLKANSGNIKFTTVDPIKTVLISNGTIVLPQIEIDETCGPTMKILEKGARICVDDQGFIWASTKRGVRKINTSFFGDLLTNEK